MKKAIAVTMVTFFVVLCLSHQYAMAQHRGAMMPYYPKSGGYEYHHGGSGISPGAVAGIAAATCLLGILFGAAAAYTQQQPQAVIVQPYPTAVPAPPPPPPQNLWYYCDSIRGYYPYVTTCPGGWRAVPSQ